MNVPSSFLVIWAGLLPLSSRGWDEQVEDDAECGDACECDGSCV